MAQSVNSNVVSAQWASRPNDQRFLTLESLHQKVLARRASSSEHSIALDVCNVYPTQGGQGDEIELIDTRGHSFGQLTNYAFGQLCAKGGAPAGFLRTLPPIMATMNLQWGLEHREKTNAEGNDAKILVRANGTTDVCSVMGPNYGRIYDSEVTSAMIEHIDLNQWKVPAASYSKSDPLRATTLYASDRDVFIFLVNESAGIDADGGTIKKGFYVWNSEVGAATFGIAMFLYDYVCDNRIIWGQRDFKELKIRHTAGGPHRFAAQAVPQLNSYISSSVHGIEATIRAAKAREVAKDPAGVTEWLKARGFTTAQARTAQEKALADPRNYNPRSIWGLVQGLTDSAHDISNTDDRTAIEAKAGSLLDLV